mgnify:CR=1 FL=1
MRNTTLCYIERGEQYLMLHRVKKEHDWRCRGVVTFLSDEWEGEYMYLFTATGFTGTLRECDEGDLEWVDKAAVPSLPLWAGDRIFFHLLAEDAPFFLLKLRYEGDTLVEAALNGAPVSL